MRWDVRTGPATRQTSKEIRLRNEAFVKHHRKSTMSEGCASGELQVEPWRVVVVETASQDHDDRGCTCRGSQSF
jgi:hypothetical protein